MSKKKKKESAPAESIKQIAPKHKQDPSRIPPTLLRTLGIILAAAAFLLYFNTRNHLYVLDDFSVIKENTMTKKAADDLGGTLKEIFSNDYRAQFDGDSQSYLYRPLSKALFAIEWNLSPDNPSIHHWVNILCYMLTGFLLFYVLFKVMRTNVVIPFAITLLYLAHPIHTEVVANIKSRDEMLSLIFALLSLLAFARWIDTQKMQQLIFGGAAYFLSMLSKESSITYVAAIPLTLWFFSGTNMKKILTVGGALAAFTVIYLLIHRSVIGDIGVDNIPVVDNSLMATTNWGEQKATAIWIMGKYLLLLLFPHPLSCDYSFNTIPIVGGANSGVIFSLLLHIGMVVYAVMKIKERDVFAWCILFYFITMSLASNILYLIGTNLAERLVYVPSLAFTAAVILILARLFKTNPDSSYGSFGAMFRQNKNLLLVTGGIALVYGFKTVDRNKDWTTVTTLFDQDIQTVPNSAHMLYYHANMTTNKDSLALKTPQEKKMIQEEALRKLSKAIEIWEQFPDAHNQVGKIWFDFKDYQKAAASYKRAVELNGTNATYQNNYGTCLFSMGQYAEAEKFFKRAIELNKVYNDALCNLGSVYGTYGEAAMKAGKQQEAADYFNKAIYYFQETAKVDKDYENAYVFLVATYKNLGRDAEGAPYQKKLNELRERKGKK
ncbi:MAG: tetratricopeptide repeat protein [Bacteroidia bacterium]|nr:tetratricopeptide repeat protein [Bacteroidia bacterium]